jgi:hypothetical protein
MRMPQGSRYQNLRNKSSLQNESSFDTAQDGNHNFPAAHDTTGEVESITLRPARETVSSIEPVLSQYRGLRRARLPRRQRRSVGA